VEHIIYDCSKNNRERRSHKKYIKPRQVAGEQKCPIEQAHKTFHAVHKFNRLRETVNLTNNNTNKSVYIITEHRKIYHKRDNYLM